MINGTQIMADGASPLQLTDESVVVELKREFGRLHERELKLMELDPITSAASAELESVRRRKRQISDEIHGTVLR